MRNLNQGFTLIEGITVILILSVLAFFSAPRLMGTDTFSVISARDQAISVVKQVQLRAMQQSESKANPCYELQVTASRLGGNENKECERSTERSDVLNLSDSDILLQMVNSNISVIRFDPLGRPWNGDATLRICQNTCQFDLEKEGVKSSFCLNVEGYVYACGK